MEKLTCSSCGATMTPNTNQPYLVCEYCDSAVENKYYIQPAEPVYAAQPGDETTETMESQTAQEPSAEAEEPTLLEKLADAGKELLDGILEQKSTYSNYSNPIIVSRPVVSKPARPRQQVQPTVPHKPATRPVAAGHSRPSGRPSGHAGAHQRPDRPGGGHGGRGGHGSGGKGPGGR